jgi:alkylation response protein AidB-like acyl-CoA dehydrogenase
MTMRFAFSAEQLLFRDSARDVLQKQCPPAAVRAAWAAESGRVAGLWAQLADLGITGLTVPEELGGMGLRELDWVLVLEEAGRAAAPEPLVETLAVGAPLLVDAGTADLRSHWLSLVASGQATIAIGLSGSPYVAFADSADLLILQHGEELHAVSRDRVKREAQPSVDGSRRLFSVDWTPSSETCFASGAQARSAAAAAFDRGALGTAAELIGLGQTLLDMTVEYAKVRRQFGQPIGSFQAIKHHLADAQVLLAFARPVVYRAAYSLSHGDPERSLHVAMAKAQASEAALGVAKAALQCHGAIGYTVEYDLHLWMKRTWALSAAWGDAAFHRARVARIILDGERGEA